MKILQLKIKHFRNIDFLDLNLNPGINIFYGNKKLTEKIELKKQEQQIIDLHSCEWI